MKNNLQFSSVRSLFCTAILFLIMVIPLKAIPWLSSDMGTETRTEFKLHSLQSNDLSWDAIKVFDHFSQMNYFFFAPQTITQNSSQTIVPGTIACGSAGAYNGNNIYYRAFNLSTEFGIVNDFDITHAEFGVESINNSLDVTINIYSTSSAFPAGFPGSATLQGSATYTVTAADVGNIVTVPVTATIPAGEILIYELISKDGQPTSTILYLGSNGLGETAPSYIVASTCGITTPTTMAGIGYPNVHVIMNIVGEEQTETGDEEACFEEDFSAITSGNNTSSSGSGSTWAGNANFPTVVQAYQAGGAVRIGSSSNIGSIESIALDDISGDVTVNIGVKGWTSIEGTLNVTLDGQTENAAYTAVMANDFETVTVEFTGVTAGATLKIATSARRAFIDSVEIICGDTVDPEPEYCIPLVDECEYDNIVNVEFSDLTNNSGGCVDPYNDYTSMVATVEQGSSHEISVTVVVDGEEYIYAFIDWNRNGTLDDEGEVFTIAAGIDEDGTYSTMISVPEDVEPGETRMRILMGYDAIVPDPCEIPLLFGARWGEVEDYTINITESSGEEPGDECSQGIASVSTIPDAYGIESSDIYRIADDFTVDADGFTLEEITIDVNNPDVPVDATINIRANNAGVPGAILHTITGAPDDSEIVGSAFGDPIYHLTFNVDTPIELEEGVYWLESTMSSPNYVWIALVDYQSSHGANLQLSNDLGGTWVADTDYSAIFTVSGTCGGDTSEPGDDECSQGLASLSTIPNALVNLSSGAQRVADDFTVDAGGFTLEEITIDVNNPNIPTDAIINIRANNAGAPGTVLHTITGAPDNSEVVGSAFGDPIYHLTFNVDTPIELEEGLYWLEATMTSTGGSWVAVADYNSTSDGANIQISLNSGTTWSPDTRYSVIFTVSGTCGDTAEPGEDCGQGDDSNGFEDGALQVGIGTDFQNTDDFIVSAGSTLTVETVELNLVLMGGPIDSIDLIFRDDASGTPGAVIETLTGLVPYAQVQIGNLFGDSAYPIYSVLIDVDALEFEGGASGATYWMQPIATAAGGATGGVFWEITLAGTLGAPIHGSELDGPWTADEDGAQAVFKLHCDEVEAPDPVCLFDITFSVEPITKVIVSDIDYGSDATINGSPALEDFTSVVGNVNRGGSYDVAFEGNTDGNFVNYFTVFIDWNQNGDWTDAGEMYEIGSITNSTGTDGQQATGSITVPTDALEGTTLMRVIKNFNSSPTNPCGSYSFGQAEDYTINVGELGISDLNSFDFTYYPNPVKDVLNISAKKGVENVSVFNLAGQKVVNNAKVANGQINVSALTPGTYVFRVTLEGGQVETFKIIKK